MPRFNPFKTVWLVLSVIVLRGFLRALRHHRAVPPTRASDRPDPPMSKLS